MIGSVSLCVCKLGYSVCLRSMSHGMPWNHWLLVIPSCSCPLPFADCDFDVRSQSDSSLTWLYAFCDGTVLHQQPSTEYSEPCIVSQISLRSSVSHTARLPPRRHILTPACRPHRPHWLPSRSSSTSLSVASNLHYIGDWFSPPTVPLPCDLPPHFPYALVTLATVSAPVLCSLAPQLLGSLGEKPRNPPAKPLTGSHKLSLVIKVAPLADLVLSCATLS